MKVGFVGDVHGAFGNMFDRMAEHPTVDVFVQLGDFGLFGNGVIPDRFDRHTYFFGGNHDNWELLKKGNLDLPDNLTYVGRPGRIDSLDINVLGGALSIDKHRRIEGRDWWREEIPSSREVEEFLDLPKAKIWATHTCPSSIARNILYPRPPMVDPLSEDFERIMENFPDILPDFWFFGHFHIPCTFRKGKTTFICVPCVHDWRDEIHGYIDRRKGIYEFNLDLL